MDELERARRRKVWTALSDLFLDTEVRQWMPRMAAEVLASGYTDDEMRAIWSRELVPEFGPNLMQVAGEWTDLPYDEDGMVARAEGRRTPSGVVAVVAPSIEDQLELVLRIRRALVDAPPEARDAIVGGLSDLFRSLLADEQPPTEALAEAVDAWLREHAAAKPPR
jgi:hypothetical protein